MAPCVLRFAPGRAGFLSSERSGVEWSGVEWSGVGNPAVDSSSSSSSSFCISDTTRTLLSCLSASSPLEMLCMRLRVVEPGAAYLRPQGGEASQHHALELESLDPSVRVWPGQDHQHRWSLREASSAARPSTDNVRARVHRCILSRSPILSRWLVAQKFSRPCSVCFPCEGEGVGAHFSSRRAFSFGDDGWIMPASSKCHARFVPAVRAARATVKSSTPAAALAS